MTSLFFIHETKVDGILVLLRACLKKKVILPLQTFEKRVDSAAKVFIKQLTFLINFWWRNKCIQKKDTAWWTGIHPLNLLEQVLKL